MAGIPNAQQEPSARIKIFIAAHTPSVFPDCASILPIQAGTATAGKTGGTVFEDMLHDDDGENISDLNPMYSELTVLYWAWKNTDADYIGLGQYRRYLNFSQNSYAEDKAGEIPGAYINAQSISEYGLNDASIAQAVTDWDIITGPTRNVHKLYGFTNLKEQWDADRHLRSADLQHMYDILCTRHPEYREDADTVLNGTQFIPNNMFVMKRNVFHDYCSWLFPLLGEFVANWDHRHADVELLRTPGHLAERLLTIYITHAQRVELGDSSASSVNGPLRVRQLQCVRFSHPEPFTPLEPLDTNPRFTVPVIFAADDDYVPVLATAITSLLRNASPDRHYDVIVLDRFITTENKQTIVASLSDYANASIRFYDMSRFIAEHQTPQTHLHKEERWNVATCYRFGIQEALPFYSKVIYLDCDVVVNGDISELYDIDLHGKAIGAVPDLDFLGNLNMKQNAAAAYASDRLHMTDPYHYFQTGVLVMDLDRMREIHSVSEWLDYASRPELTHHDQDVLNMECEEDVAYLPYEWNVLHNCGGRVNTIFSYAPADAFRAYLESRKHPNIIHYAGPDKPWTNPWCDFGPLYWSYARTTPFSLQIMAMLADVRKPKPVEFHERAIAEDHPARKYVDKVAPIGSRQREVMKAVARRVQGKQ
ncbi:DUF4422 domain-containing protein [Bifidobacterium platyrrhinorum]|uniref:DUF4422 domain-containing protein n=1 Tax=Bifidobacterium platyrrhinorum TaxID=2661628 RepID=A0A6L9SRP3_9BIFI|nr:DUF4422 domain-containing protein [Bifidobacterium platyrrhinorum]NEG54855.1 DUF4422 domain-containing protein [Bifidobacterium platyrrhinorum]